MAKLNTIELEKSVSDIVSKVFKLGGSSEKMASSVVNSLITKMVFGTKEEQKTIISSLVPDVLSATDAIKLFGNIEKYKLEEKEKLIDFMSSLDIVKTEKKTENKTESRVVEKVVEKKAIANDQEL